MRLWRVSARQSKATLPPAVGQGMIAGWFPWAHRALGKQGPELCGNRVVGGQHRQDAHGVFLSLLRTSEESPKAATGPGFSEDGNWARRRLRAVGNVLQPWLSLYSFPCLSLYPFSKINGPFIGQTGEGILRSTTPVYLPRDPKSRLRTSSAGPFCEGCTQSGTEMRHSHTAKAQRCTQVSWASLQRFSASKTTTGFAYVKQ